MPVVPIFVKCQLQGFRILYILNFLVEITFSVPSELDYDWFDWGYLQLENYIENNWKNLYTALNWDQNETFPQFQGDHTIMTHGFSTILEKLASSLDINFKKALVSYFLFIFNIQISSSIIKAFRISFNKFPFSFRT